MQAAGVAPWKPAPGGAYPGIRTRTESGFAEVAEADAARVECYTEHLRSKYGGNFRIASIPKDPQVLERLGGSMHGDDVVIAPDIVAEMARDPEVGAWYEGIIDHCFATVPQDKAYFASMGLTFEPCGVVVHADGTVTYICGGGDSPEKVARVNAIHAAREARRAAQRYAIRRTQEEHRAQVRRREAAEAQTAQLEAAVRCRCAIPGWGR